MDDIKTPAPTPKPQKNTTPATAKTSAEVDETVVIDGGNIEEPPTKVAPGKNSGLRWYSFRTRWDSWSKRRKIITSSIAGLVVLGLIIFALLVPLAGPPKIPSASYVKSHPAAKTVPSPLTGVQVDPLLAQRPVTGIMIENSEQARPQSGLQDAGVVYEAIAEAGITRFLALFQDSSPQYIGPVRSLRPYFIDYAAPFQASIVHVGGSPDALSEVTDGSYRNLDQFYNGGFFTRVSSREAPHNVYTSFNQLDQLNESKGFTKSSYTTWPRKADKKLATPTAKTIDFRISSPSYYVHYDYDKASNSYLRSEGGAAHTDLVSASDNAGVQLKPKVVIALVVPLSQGALDASGAYYSDYATAGSGQAFVFQDGGVTAATWTKNGTFGQLGFTDSQGHALKLNAGQTWLTLVSDSGQVSYAP